MPPTPYILARVLYSEISKSELPGVKLGLCHSIQKRVSGNSSISSEIAKLADGQYGQLSPVKSSTKTLWEARNAFSTTVRSPLLEISTGTSPFANEIDMERKMKSLFIELFNWFQNSQMVI